MRGRSATAAGSGSSRSLRLGANGVGFPFPDRPRLVEPALPRPSRRRARRSRSKGRRARRCIGSSSAAGARWQKRSGRRWPPSALAPPTSSPGFHSLAPAGRSEGSTKRGRSRSWSLARSTFLAEGCLRAWVGPTPRPSGRAPNGVRPCEGGSSRRRVSRSRRGFSSLTTSSRLGRPLRPAPRGW